MNVFISGLYGSADKGLGLYLEENFQIDESCYLSAEFMEFKFHDQISQLSAILQGGSPTNIIAVSYGAYLLLNLLNLERHSQARLLLISPVLGITMIGKSGRIPKNYKKFKQSIVTKSLVIPPYTKIIMGADDPTSSDKTAELLFANYPEIEILKIPDNGHRLPHKIIQHEVSLFLGE